MLKFIVAIFVSILALTAARAGDAPTFQAGQMWSVRDSGVRIVIGRIEPFASGKTAISVSVFDVPCPRGMGCVTTIVAHAPFDSDALTKSVDHLLSNNTQTAPNFEDGYRVWKQAKGGIYTVPVSELPTLLFRAITPQTPETPARI